MSRPRVAVIDYGIGNLLSVRRALEHCGAEVLVTADAAALLDSPRVILPGVGAFANGMSELQRAGLDSVARQIAARGTPLLGICLGMQMLFEESEEFGATRGLGLIPGRVVAVPSVDTSGRAQKIPHIGWNGLMSRHGQSWAGTPLADITPGAAVYFVHSFMAEPANRASRIADTLYGGVPISAVVGQANVFGCQFHPEKSGAVGLTVLRTFLGFEQRHALAREGARAAGLGKT